MFYVLYYALARKLILNTLIWDQPQSCQCVSLVLTTVEDHTHSKPKSSRTAKDDDGEKRRQVRTVIAGNSIIHNGAGHGVGEGWFVTYTVACHAGVLAFGPHGLLQRSMAGRKINSYINDARHRSSLLRRVLSFQWGTRWLGLSCLWWRLYLARCPWWRVYCPPCLWSPSFVF